MKKILPVVCLCMSGATLAEPVDPVTEKHELTAYQRYQRWLDNFLMELGADGQFNPEKGIDWSVMPGPFYTPEKKLGMGVSAVGLYKPDINDAVSQPSSITINGFGSINGAYGVSIHNANYLANDRYRLFLDAEMTDSPDVFHGIGVEAGKHNERVDYERRTYAASITGMVRVLPFTYLGMGLAFSHNEALNPEQEQTDAPWIGEDIAKFPGTQRNVGAMLSATYDSRDFALNASKGRLIELAYFNFNTALGADSDFERVTLNYSDYHSMSVIPGVLAWQVRAESNFGDVRWDQMALLGGADALRGYEQGQYRDKNMLISQVEYRQPLGGRHGMVYWFGAGTLAEEFDLLGEEDWLYSVGVGYRFEIKQRVNLRLDMGFGNDQSGFYFAINEAF
ncbi:BamA/TamA family outer membrane protein [Photobacterium rosenbergii]|uniref:BamA/TamA family outer membrane protein n=1 Tax=Photobacterium rosenbergii TaxID=294936 RepID=A0ABU3ZCB5_9GAMM|nr:BamA/TamA family outer membrane protein [Photobacterium rosenbergii]MDV5167742.1 BamA/TamA family outer membrane protein [Photobacterium rosenbergii]